MLVEFEHCRLLDLSLFGELPEELPVPTHIKLELDLPQELTRITDISTSADGQTWAAGQALSDASLRLLIGNWVDGRPTVLTKIDVPECRVGRVALSPDADSVAAMANGRLLLAFRIRPESSCETVHARGDSHGEQFRSFQNGHSRN